MSEDLFFRNIRKIVNYVLGSVLVMVIASVSHTLIKFEVLERSVVENTRRINELCVQAEKLREMKADKEDLEVLQRSKANKENVNLMFENMKERFDRKPKY